MPEQMKWSYSVQAVRGPTVAGNGVLEVDAYLKLNVTVPANGTLKLAGHLGDDLGVASPVLRLKVENGTELHPKPYREGKSFKLADGVSFVHIASVERADGSNPLSELPAFRAFQENIGDRCDEPPVPIEFTEIGSYGFFGG